MAAEQHSTRTTRKRLPDSGAGALPPLGAMAPGTPALRAMLAPHWHLTEHQAAELLEGASRAELLDLAKAGTRLAAERDGRPGHELPNRNALLLAFGALGLLLFAGPRAAIAPGGAA